MIINHQGKAYRCITSLEVIAEVLSKKDKFATTEKEIKEWIKTKEILVVSSPSSEEKDSFDTVVRDRKDRHVLAAARRHGVKILLSYDIKHIVTVNVKNALSPILVLTPQQFLQKKPL